VDIAGTAIEDLRGIGRLMLSSAVVRFALVGIASTLVYALLFLALAGPIGSLGASALALTLTAVANTAVNRRFTFGVRGREALVRHHLAGFLVYLTALALTTAALALLHALDPHPARLVEAGVLVLASLCATIMRYVALSTWVFQSQTLGSANGRQSVASRAS
jgi:putative flippase GtrA